MKNKILIIFLIIILSGCSARVNLEVTKDNKVNEKIYVSTKTKNIELAGLENQEFIELAKKAYDVNLIKEYTMEEKQIEDNYGILFARESSNICSSLKKSYFSSFFDEITCEKKNDTYEIKATSLNLICKESCMSYDYGIDDSLIFEIQLPEKAVSSNAKKEEDNKYVWEFKKNEKVNLSLTIKRYAITTTKASNNEETKKSDKESKMIFLVIIVLFIIVSLLAVIIYDKYKKNKLEY